jgi:hemoglobin/transferrin/lactoferrin receptor protein
MLKITHLYRCTACIGVWGTAASGKGSADHGNIAMNYKHLGHGVSALALACALQSATASAQNTAAQTEEPVAAEDGSILLDTITIYATLSPTSSFDYPGTVSVVDYERIQELQASDLDDLFKGIPGAVVDGGPRRSGQVPTIRGNRDEDVLVLLDGARQNFIAGHDGRLFIEPELLKQMEVVKGPISALYGSGALGGVIALTTVDAADFLEEGETSGVRVKAGFQSVNDEFLISTTAFTRSHDGKWDIVGNISYRDSGDIELGNGSTLPDEHEIKSGLLKGTVQLAPGLSFNASWVHYDDDGITPNNPQGNTIGGVPSGDSIPVDVFRYVLSDTVQGTLSYNPADNDLIDGNLQVYWSRNEVEEDEVNSDRVLFRGVETTGIKLDNRSRFSISDWGKLTLTYGTEYYRDLQTGKDNAPLGTSPGPFFDPTAISNIPGGKADFFGVFTQAELVVAKPLGAPGELTLLPGVRWDTFSNSFDGDIDNYDDIDEQAISPKFGISYKPTPWLLLFGNYGEAFRAPSFNEAYATGNHFPVFTSTGTFLGYNQFIPNPGLKPQDGNMIELGGGLDFKDVLTTGDGLKLKGSYWQSEVTDFIDLEVSMACLFSPLPCTSQNVNIANAELDGVEIELAYDTARYFGRVGFSHIDGRDQDTGEFLGVLQPDKLYVEAGLKFPEIWSRFGTRVTFADDFTKVNEESELRDGYTTVDLFAVIEPGDGPLKGLRLDLGIENILDAEYEVIAAGAVEPGINFKAAAAWTYKW